jgi:hypothetical protein
VNGNASDFNLCWIGDSVVGSFNQGTQTFALAGDNSTKGEIFFSVNYLGRTVAYMKVLRSKNDGKVDWHGSMRLEKDGTVVPVLFSRQTNQPDKAGQTSVIGPGYSEGDGRIDGIPLRINLYGRGSVVVGTMQYGDLIVLPAGYKEMTHTYSIAGIYTAVDGAFMCVAYHGRTIAYLKVKNNEGDWSGSMRLEATGKIVNVHFSTLGNG